VALGGKGPTHVVASEAQLSHAAGGQAAWQRSADTRGYGKKPIQLPAGDCARPAEADAGVDEQ